MNRRFRLEEVTDLGFSLAELTRRSGCTWRTVQRLAAGDPTIRPQTVAKIRRALETLKEESAQLYRPKAKVAQG
jgi:predicted transcriptional regulator